MKLVFFSLIMIVSGCQRPADLSAERESLLRLHDDQRRAHFQEDLTGFIDAQADRFIQVQSGQIQFPPREERLARFRSYFDQVEFVRWDDLDSPLVVISDDATLANTFVKKLVVVKYPDEKGHTILDTTQFAWTATYQKQNSAWKLIAMTSTRAR